MLKKSGSFSLSNLHYLSPRYSAPERRPPHLEPYLLGEGAHVVQQPLPLRLAVLGDGAHLALRGGCGLLQPLQLLALLADLLLRASPSLGELGR